MKRGQTNVIAFFSVSMVLIAIFLIAPGAMAFFKSMMGTDGFVNILLEYSWIFILLAAIIAFFTYNAVRTGQ